MSAIVAPANQIQSGRTFHISKITEVDHARVAVADVEIVGNLIIVNGENGEGKSSFIEGAVSALCGQKLDVPEPIRRGADVASVALELVEPAASSMPDHLINVTWHRTADGVRRTLYVSRRADPNSDYFEPVSAPQTYLNRMLGPFVYNPFRIMREIGFASGKNALLTKLSEACGITAEMAKLERERDAVNRKKLDLDKIIDQDEAILRTMAPTIQSDTAVSETDEQEINQQIEKVRSMQRASEEAARRVTNATAQCNIAASSLSGIDNQIASLVNQLDQLKASRAVAEQNLKSANEALTPVRVAAAAADAALQSMTDIGTLLAKRDAISQKLAVARTFTKLNTMRNELDGKKTQSIELANQVRTIDQSKINLIRSTVIGGDLAGIGINDRGDFTFNGMLLDSMSDAQKLRFILLVAMASQPTIKFVTVDEGDMLDRKHMEELRELAKKYNFQILISSVYNDENADVVLAVTDGTVRIKEQPGIDVSDL